jgi:hypothetical protein
MQIYYYCYYSRTANPRSLPQNFDNSFTNPIGQEMNQSKNVNGFKTRNDFRETWLWANIQTE